MKNTMDSRNRSAFDIVSDLGKLDRRRILGVLGTHQVEADELADGLRAQWSQVVDTVGFEPVRLVTGCAPVGAEKAARLVARSVTGKLAVVFHRAEMTYGKKQAEEMRDLLVAQESGALLLLTRGRVVCKHARYLFGARGKRVHEIEVG